MEHVSALHDNPQISGKQLFLVSMISPEGNQKHKVHGFKLHDVCESEEEAKMLQQYYHKLDPDFDILVGTLGKWVPWVFNVNDVPNLEYANDQLNTLVKTHRMTKKTEDKDWIDRIENHKKNMENTTGKDAQEKIMEENKETSISMMFRIKQLELCVLRRKTELESLLHLYNEKFDNNEKSEAVAMVYPPLTEPSLMFYQELPTTTDFPVQPKKTLQEIKAEILESAEDLE